MATTLSRSVQFACRVTARAIPSVAVAPSAVMRQLVRGIRHRASSERGRNVPVLREDTLPAVTRAMPSDIGFGLDPIDDLFSMLSPLSPVTRNLLSPIVPEMLREVGATTGFERWIPNVDIQENEKAITFEVEVPGMKPKDLQINAKDGVLTVTGERVEEHKERAAGGRVRRVERMYGNFIRRFTLPHSADTNNVNAVLKHGVLVITVPKKESAEHKQGSVPIRLEAEAESKPEDRSQTAAMSSPVTGAIAGKAEAAQKKE